MNRQKLFRCRYCKEKFPYNELQVKMPQVCKGCIMDYFKEYKSDIVVRAKRDVKTKEKQRLNRMREDLMSLSDWLKIAQKHFNNYIRERDKDLPCISCGEHRKHYDAGHLFTVGAHPELRFNEDNCHKQCVFCNRHQHGNVSSYFINIVGRIGEDRFNKLLEARNQLKKYTIDDVKDIIQEYKQKIKEID